MNRRELLGGMLGATCMSNEDDELEGDEEIGTVLRPLHRPQQGYIAEWERAPNAKVKPTWDPTIRWGDAVEIQRASGQLGIEATRDLLNVTLPKSVVAQVQFRADVVSIPDAVTTPATFPQVRRTTLELVVGNGSQLTVVRKRYNHFPMVGPAASLLPGTPLDVLFTFPLTNVRGRISLDGNNVKVRYSLWLSPLFEVK